MIDADGRIGAGIVFLEQRGAEVGRGRVVGHELGAARVEGQYGVAEQGVGSEAACDADEDAEGALAG